MTNETDPVLSALNQLAAPGLTAASDARVRARCHAAMAARSQDPSAVSRPAVARLTDVVMPMAVVLYGLVTFAEALQMAGLW